MEAVLRQAESSDSLSFATSLLPGSCGRARLAERICHVWSDAEIEAQIPAWQGCDAELTAVADELARYYELGGR